MERTASATGAGSSGIAACSDVWLCHMLAAGAGTLLVHLREQGGKQPELRAMGDRMSHRYLVAALSRLRPHDAMLSEEGADDRRRLTSDRVWIVDPLDGTREFGELGRTDWAVHVALWVDGQLAAGAVALPALPLTMSTWTAPSLPPRMPGRLRVLVSRTRPPQLATLMAERLEADLVPMGSAGAKVVAVARGFADVYAHAGGQYEWDSAAPVAVAAAAGLHASRLDGSALQYNRADPYLPDLLVCRPEIADRVLGAISAVQGCY